MAGSLYIVPTPIGNLADITFRAVEVLKSVSVIAAEDTRRTSILLRHYGVNSSKNRLLSLHEHNQVSRTMELIKKMSAGESVALVSDAGTPLISDPGSYLISKAIESDIKIVSLPGPSAILTALTGSGFLLDEFLFLGFLPKKRGAMIKRFEQLRDSPLTIIFFDSPNRIKKTLNILLDVLGDRRIVICREMTKLYEEIIRGSISELASGLKENLKGEITVVVEGAGEGEIEVDVINDRILELIKKGERVSAIADQLHKELGVSKKGIYSLALKLNKK
ncbi:MAG: 16S rRNA (cytidine(1402)-2'-O)-methyltransferase [Deltaproteobacteria bacterium RIFCSPHIGHO2_12_FULL_43_9]|nr:MAG: 16S rRNA (cytidine(1402)-2'-O)-methyltransferase [Deltaproteobacteria bacterium RIFCSPHIGHO2_12_FULL_43_9]